MNDEKYIKRAIELAKNARATAAPNPMVGAVVVHNGKIIGEGYHVKSGQPHAEVNAIRSVKDKTMLADSTIYVTLEPCAHYGKTPPCAKLIIDMKIPRVVVGCKDPFSEVDGKGIEMLRQAGCSVKVGVLEDECRELIKRFVVFHTEKRPYIQLKWAESADGYMDVLRTDGTPVVLSNALTSVLTHKRRSEVKAILVGRSTAILDNPSLTVRHWRGENPLRVVIDKDLSVPASSALFDDSAPTIVFNSVINDVVGKTEYVCLDFSGDVLGGVLSFLYSRNIQSLMVEGGAFTLNKFIDKGLWDEAVVEKTRVSLGNGVSAPVMKVYSSLTEEQHFGHFFLCYER